MEIVPEARYFAEYWEEFGPHSQYEVFLEGEIKERLVQTKSGHRLVGAAVRIGRGALLAVPALVLDEDAFMETKHVDGKEEQFWTESARRFGKRFVSSLVGLRESLLSEVESTPPPSWAQNDDYRLAEEGKIEKQIEDATARIAALEDSKRAFEAQLLAAGSIRGLLFEQGRPLEQAVLQALSLLGFKAERLRENNSEFDAVFVSDEGRCLGEVEGKDNRLLILTSSVSWSGT